MLYIELNITGPSYGKYLVSFKNFSCTGIEEKLIECSTIPARDNYDCFYKPENIAMQPYTVVSLVYTISQ